MVLSGNATEVESGIEKTLSEMIPRFPGIERQ